MRYFKLIISENGKYYRKSSGLKQNDCTRFLADNYVSWIESNTANLRICNYLQYYQNLFPKYTQAEIEKAIVQFANDLKKSDQIELDFKNYPNIFPLYQKMLANLQNNFDWALYQKSKIKQMRLLMIYNYLIGAVNIPNKTLDKIYNELKATKINELKQFEYNIIQKIIKIIYYLKTNEIYMLDRSFFDDLPNLLGEDSYLLTKIKEIR